jgi:TPR repeat protein
MCKIILLNFCLIGIVVVLFGCKKNDSKDVSEMTVPELQMAAQQGNNQAMNKLGLLYDLGQEGITQNFDEAVKWFRKAANDKDPEAQYWMSYVYLHGTGVDKNLSEAVKWFRLSADVGQPWAQTVLGHLYERGLGVEKDDKKAFDYIKKAAIQGYPFGQEALGTYFLKGIGTETNLAEAFTWFQKSAESGYDKAQVELGRCYVYGWGVEQNSDQAFVWFQKAAMQGNPDAEMEMSFHRALDKPKDLIESCKWVTLANDKDPQIGDLALNTLKKAGVVFSAEQIAAGKQRAEEFMKTNQFALPSKDQINGL